MMLLAVAQFTIVVTLHHAHILHTIYIIDMDVVSLQINKVWFLPYFLLCCSTQFQIILFFYVILTDRRFSPLFFKIRVYIIILNISYMQRFSLIIQLHILLFDRLNAKIKSHRMNLRRQMQQRC